MESDNDSCKNLSIADLNSHKIDSIHCEQQQHHDSDSECEVKAIPSVDKPTRKVDMSLRFEKFEQLKKRRLNIQEASKLRQLKTEKYKAMKRAKKSERDRIGKTGNTVSNEGNKEKWSDIKPFLTVNDHLQGPIPHGNCGPKTELECIIDDAIKDGDMEKAEILSDSLANREFAVKISNAFAAKRYAEKKAEMDAQLRARNVKKIRWGFEVKERWQMKGNM